MSSEKPGVEPLIDAAIRQLKPRSDGAVEFKAFGIDLIRKALRAMPSATERWQAAQRLVMLAHFLDVEMKSPAASRELLSALEPLKAEVDSHLVHVATQATHGAAPAIKEQFRAMTGEASRREEVVPGKKEDQVKPLSFRLAVRC